MLDHSPQFQLLLLQSDTKLSPGLFSEEDCFSRRRWKQVQYLSNIFWRRWSKECLPQLQIRQKWLRKRRNLTVGDVVLVSADNSPRNTWPLGRVLKVHSDKKGIVRRVTIKPKSGFWRDQLTNYAYFSKLRIHYEELTCTLCSALL